MVRARIGVLALQGDFAEHLKILEGCGYRVAVVRSKHDLESVNALIIPGGESTTILKLINRLGLRDPLTKHIADGMPVFGTCAGAIVLARRVSDGGFGGVAAASRYDLGAPEAANPPKSSREEPLGLLDVSITRNAYGRQVDSFEADLDVEGFDEPVKGVFIRAPVIDEVGTEVETMASWGDRPVLVRSNNLLASTFHPELAGEHRIHKYFVEHMIAS